MPRKNQTSGVQEYGDDPSPEDIRQACARIQSTWSRGEEYRRRTFPHIEDSTSFIVPYELPEATARVFDGADRGG